MRDLLNKLDNLQERAVSNLDNKKFVAVKNSDIQSDIKKNSELFEAYGISKGKIDDPNKKSINALFKEIHILNEKIIELQKVLNNLFH